MKSDTQRECILKTVHDRNIEYISLWFTDILGFLKSFTITREELADALENGTGFDGSSIEGFARIDESDMFAVPDPSTFAVLPWKAYDGVEVARMFCDIVTVEGDPYPGDPRYILKQSLKEAARDDFEFFVGPELEFFYFKDSANPPQPLDKAGYFDQVPSDIGRALRKKTIKVLKAMDIAVETSHHEVAHSQHEIDLRYCEALKMADQVMTYRFVVKEVAVENGYYATFMPKPIHGLNGSGMHVNMSLFKDGQNAFNDAEQTGGLSDLCQHFIAGLLKHARELTAITNQWINSYKRLTPGYEAPVYISWAMQNRSDLVRIPVTRPGKRINTRVEYRAPDPACNPYLAFSALLSAGLEGVNQKYLLEKPYTGNLYKMSYHERRDAGIRQLPGDLHEAVIELERSALMRRVLGDHVFINFIKNKMIEWDAFRTHVTGFEIDRYLAVL
ncbi:glutamine synthetase family protein [bacterium]|nr:glutamine synthetase family protein [bacterium]